MHEEPTIKDILLANKINGLVEELIDTIKRYIKENKEEFISSIDHAVLPQFLIRLYSW